MCLTEKKKPGVHLSFGTLNWIESRRGRVCRFVDTNWINYTKLLCRVGWDEVHRIDNSIANQSNWSSESFRIIG